METKQFCEECGATLEEGDRFCPECGTAVPPPVQPAPRFCEECGNAIGEEEKFCENCGAPADPGDAPASSKTRSDAEDSAAAPIATGGDQPVSGDASAPARSRPAFLVPLAGIVVVLIILGGCVFVASKVFTSVIGNGGGSSDKTTLKLDEQSVQLGETATVPLWLVDAEAITELSLTISYDESSLELAGEAAAGSIAPAASVTVKPAGAGVLQVVVRDKAGISGTGALVKIPFKITGRRGVTRDLELSLEEAVDASGKKPGIRLIDGEISVAKK